MPAKPSPNIQDSFLFGALREGRPLAFSLITGKALKGHIVRFDRFAILLKTSSGEILIYKHAIEAIAELPTGTPSAASESRPPW